MRTIVMALSMLAALGAAGCSGKEQTVVAGAATAPGPAAVTVNVPATATATTTAPAAGTGSAAAVPRSAAAPKPRRKAPKSYEALRAELERKCPMETKDTNVEQKEAFSDSNECLRRTMIADLDAVLLPLKKADAAKFEALMKEQAEWNRAVEVACDLEEERFWIDLVTGGRDDGTLRSYAYMGCMEGAYTERILFARSLAAKDLGPLVKRIEATQKDGEEAREQLSHLRKTAEAFVLVPPAPPDGMESADWKSIGESGEKVAASAVSMAKSTCEAWPDLAKALGGRGACEAKMELHYTAQVVSPSST